MRMIFTMEGSPIGYHWVNHEEGIDVFPDPGGDKVTVSISKTDTTIDLDSQIEANVYLHELTGKKPEFTSNVTTSLGMCEEIGGK